MRKLLVPFAFLGATTAVACSFQMRAGSDPNAPQGNQPQPTQQGQSTAAQPATTPAPTSTVKTGARVGFGKNKFPTPTPTTTPSATATATPTGPITPAPAPAGVPVVSGNTPFGHGTPDPNGWKGNLYWIPAGTTKLPALAQQQPNGYLFIKELNIAVRPFTEGFPGVDANRKENFAIRYEAPLVVENEADYEFKLSADDGAVLRIDDLVIVDNDGSHDFKAVTGPVHLVRGTHVMVVDYFQTTGNVGLQLHCKKVGDATDKICTNRL